MFDYLNLNIEFPKLKFLLKIYVNFPLLPSHEIGIGIKIGVVGQPSILVSLF